MMAGGEPLGDLYLTEKAGGEEFSERDEEAVQWRAGFAGVAIDHARPYPDLKSCHSELRQAIDALDATMRIARAVGGEIDVEVILGLVAKRGQLWCPPARRPSSASTIGPGHRDEHSDGRDRSAHATGDRAEADAAPGSSRDAAQGTPA